MFGAAFQQAWNAASNAAKAAAGAIASGAQKVGAAAKAAGQAAGRAVAAAGKAAGAAITAARNAARDAAVGTAKAVATTGRVMGNLGTQTVSDILSSVFAKVDRAFSATWIGRPVQGCKCKEMREAAEFAKIADAVYSPDNPPPKPWQRVSADNLEEMGLDPGQFQDSNSGFAAALYKNADTGQYTLAFRGTENAKDWIANVQQGAGIETEQYRLAEILAVNVKAATRGNLSYTGHSLGGGLASYASLQVGGPATVFNPAGVHVMNRPLFSEINNEISLYHVVGDPLTELQDTLPGLMPRAVGDRTTLAATGGVPMSLRRHGMAEVKDSLDAKIAVECS